MKLERLKNLFSKNKQEYEEINSEKFTKCSDGFLEDRLSINTTIGNLIEHYLKCCDEKNNEYSVYKCRKLEKEMYNQKRGKIKDIISTIFGQADKHIKNKLFCGEKRSCKKRWKFYSKMVRTK